MGAASCVHPAPAMLDERTAVISGRETAQSAPADAIQKAMVLAAKITVDHGFRYFRVVGADNQFAMDASSIRPGQDVIIKVFHDGETSIRTAGIWDAETILTVGVRQMANISVPAQTAPHSVSGASPPPAGTHCTAYGCDW
jgi:hypothetical protein